MSALRMKIVLLTNSARKRSAKIHVWVSYVVVELNVKLNITRQFVFALVECKEIHWFLVLRLDAFPIRIVPRRKNAIICLLAIKRSVNPFVRVILVRLVLLVLLKIIEKHVLVIIRFKAMDMSHVPNVSTCKVVSLEIYT